MSTSTRTPALCVAAVGLALAAGGCGSSDSSGTGGGGGLYGSNSGGSSTSATTAPSPEATGAAVISAASAPKLGKIIVDPKGFTLYDFHADKGTTSNCYGGCAKAWPPLTTEGPPQTGEGAMASKVGTTKRKDGTIQVTYAGHPLYTFAGDKKPGEANGNDFSQFGAQWYALLPSGEEAEG